MFTPYQHVSHVKCHMSGVTCHVVGLVGGGSVINGPNPSSFYSGVAKRLVLEMRMLRREMKQRMRTAPAAR